MATKQQLQKFVKVRNASPFQGNLQFVFDAEECGIEPTIFDRPDNLNNNGGYIWHLDAGIVVERAAKLKPFAFYDRSTIIDFDTGEPVRRETVAKRFA